MQAVAAAAKEKAAGDEAARIKVRALEQRIRETAAEVHILPNSRYPARTHSHSLIVYRMFG